MTNVWGTSLRLREARAWLERALDPARAVAAPPALRAGAARGLGWIAMCLGDYDDAEVWLGEALAIRRSFGDVLGAAHALTVLGKVAEQRGDEEGAQARFAEAMAGFQATGHLPGIAWSFVAQADAAHRRGEYGEAARLAGEAVAVARESGNQHQLADTLLCFGYACSDRADWAAAVVALREALGLGRDLGNRMVCTGILVGLAEVAVATGEAGRAARLLGAVAALMESGGLAQLYRPATYQRAVAAARAALDEDRFAAASAAGRVLSLDEAIAEGLAVTAPPGAAPSMSLSAREREILALLADGRTHRAIAEALFISERTVDSHVARTYHKLGVRSRDDAVAAARTAGLVASESPPSPAAP